MTRKASSREPASAPPQFGDAATAITQPSAPVDAGITKVRWAITPETYFKLIPICVSLLSLSVAAFSLYFTYLQQQRLESERMTPFKVAMFQKRLESYEKIQPYFTKSQAYANEVVMVASIVPLILLKDKPVIDIPLRTCSGPYEEFQTHYRDMRKTFDESAHIWGPFTASYIINVHQAFRDMGAEYAKYCGPGAQTRFDEQRQKAMLEPVAIATNTLRNAIVKASLALDQEIGFDGLDRQPVTGPRTGEAISIDR